MRYLPFLLLTLAIGACENRPALPDVAPEVLHFRAEMAPENVVTGTPEATSNARGIATAELTGRSLYVTGSFEGLSSPLRDLHETPDDPGIHIHPGAEGQENGYIFGLKAELGADGRSGTFAATFELSDEQLAMLFDRHLYMDIHTVQNDAGEVRDQLRPDDSEAADRARQRVRPARDDRTPRPAN